MKRSVSRIKKIGLQHLIHKLTKLERRMERLLKEYYATQDTIQFFQKENNLKPEEINNALLTARTKDGTQNGTPESQGTRPVELPLQSSNVEALVETGTPEVQDNPPVTEVSS